MVVLPEVRSHDATFVRVIIALPIRRGGSLHCTKALDITVLVEVKIVMHAVEGGIAEMRPGTVRRKSLQLTSDRRA